MEDFYSLSRESLSAILSEEFNLPAYRANQVFDWVYRKGVTNFEEMSNLGKEVRSRLVGRFYFPRATIVSRQISVDGTRKYLFKVNDGIEVESVMIKQPDRMTLCVSSQVGCGMGCRFCQTATMGFQKNLTAGDIIRQVLAVREDAIQFNDDFSNIVFMGMGEPLHNFKGVSTACSILRDELGIGIAPRKITVSTVGLVPAIKKFMSLDFGVNLAVSLNATTDSVRSAIMPINDRYSIDLLLNTLKDVPLARRKKVTIEYVLLSGVNDTKADLERLPAILAGVKCKVNLIPYNENAGLGFKSPEESLVHRWYRYLNDRQIPTTIRWSKGQDIDAACGQLKTRKDAQSLSTISVVN